jgi:hypothetical protein
MPGSAKSTCFHIAPKGHDRVRVLIRHQKKCPSGINREIAGSFTSRGLVRDEGQLTVSLIYLEGSNTVMTAIGTVKEPAIGSNMDISTGILARKIGGQRGNCLYLFQSSPDAIAREGCHCSVQFIYDVGVRVSRMKSQVTRSATRFDLYPRRLVWD